MQNREKTAEILTQSMQYLTVNQKKLAVESLAGVTDGKEYEAFFTRKTSAGKATGAPYEWK